MRRDFVLRSKTRRMPVNVWTMNVSISGMFLETNDRPPVGMVQDISIVWGETYICSTRIVRHADDGIGLTYIDPDPSFLGIIEEIIGNSETSR